MNLTVNDILKATFRIMGVIAKSEVPTYDEMQDGLQALNMMLDSWSARKLMLMAEITESFNLTAGTGSYTIGTGGDFNTWKPYQISSAFIRDGNNIDLPLDIINQEQYNNQIDKTTQARPIALMYDPGLTQQAAPVGTINLYYVPDASTPYTLFITSTKPLTEFSSLTTAITFDKAYSEAIKYNLAIRMWREYNEDTKAIPTDITYLAKESMRVLESLNATQVIARMEIPGVKSVFNIYTGDYVGQ